MNPMLHVRTVVLGVTQAELAAIALTSQGTVSKWEAGELAPDRDQLVRIRDAVKNRELPWSDEWFFEAPVASAHAQQQTV